MKIRELKDKLYKAQKYYLSLATINYFDYTYNYNRLKRQYTNFFKDSYIQKRYNPKGKRNIRQIEKRLSVHDRQRLRTHILYLINNLKKEISRIKKLEGIR